MQKFIGKTVLITGAASGIGKATALAFAQEGAKVALSDIQQERGEATLHQIQALGAEVTFHMVDVRDFDAVQAWVRHTSEVFGSIDIGINNAGIEGVMALTHEYPAEIFQKVMDINVIGVWNCIKAQVPYMLAQKSGAIVNVASVAGVQVLHGGVAYNASKHAVIGITKTAGIEYVRQGIRTNAVCPSFIDTPMVTESLVKNNPKMSIEKLAQLNPTKRLGTAQEVASVILFLSSQEASYINASAVMIDGGLSVI